MTKTKNDNVQLLDLKLNVPNHDEELNHANDELIELRKKFQEIQKNNLMNNSIHLEMYEATIKILDYVGRLSLYVFDLSSEIELKYTKKFIKAPELAKTLWLKHYGMLHNQYDLIKNRCFKLLDDIDDEYIKIYKKYPPNWKP